MSFQDETLLLGGDPAAVESYLARLRATAGHAMRVAGIDSGSLANAASRLAGLTSLLADSGKYVQLHRDSLNALKDGNLIPFSDGFFRMTTNADASELLAPLQWRPAGLGPEAIVSAQMIAVQMALTSAVAQVEDAVRRVEDKVESVLEVARAQRAGDVLGNSLTISRMVDSLEKYGSLPDAYWDSVAVLGPALNVTVEQLRNHVRRILASFDHTLAVQQRTEKLRNAINDNLLGDTLSLLVIAEGALNKWQRLNLGESSRRNQSSCCEQSMKLASSSIVICAKTSIYTKMRRKYSTGSPSRRPWTASDFYRCESWPSTAAPFATSSTVSPRPATTRSRLGRTSTFPACSMPPSPPSGLPQPPQPVRSRSWAEGSRPWAHSWPSRSGTNIPTKGQIQATATTLNVRPAASDARNPNCRAEHAAVADSPVRSFKRVCPGGPR